MYNMQDLKERLLPYELYAYIIEGSLFSLPDFNESI